MPQNPFLKNVLIQISDMLEFMHTAKGSEEPLPADINEKLELLQKMADELTHITKEMTGKELYSEEEIQELLKLSKEFDPSLTKVFQKTQDLLKNANVMKSQVENMQEMLKKKNEAKAEVDKQQEENASLQRKDKKQLHLKGVRKGWTKL